jgi:pyridoxal phosphate enzyme (YggS family)
VDVDTREAISERLEEVRGRIASAARSSGRDPATVVLVGVSKTFGADVLQAALDAGIEDLGENRAQEFKQKVLLLGARPRWHFVGHLQTNKAKDVVGAAVLIHSVDRYGLAEAVAARATRRGLVQDVLVEVNVSAESRKHGVEPARALRLAEDVESLEGVRVRGLMTMPPFTRDPETSRAVFSELRALSEHLRARVPQATHLSMGMTQDFEVAIEEGATIVRIGEAIFGPRTAE